MKLVKYIGLMSISTNHPVSPALAQSGRRMRNAPQRSVSAIATLSSWVTVLIIATLPLANFRFGLLSLPMVGMAAATLLFFIQLALRLGFYRWHNIDLLLFGYLVICLATLSPNAASVLLPKTLLYCLGFIAIRCNLRALPNIDKTLRTGATFGLSAFVATMIIGSFLAGLRPADFMHFSYWRVTFKIFRALSFSDPSDFESADIVKNTLANSIVLISAILATNRRFGWIAAAAASLFLLQSRRSIGALAYIIATNGKVSWQKVLLVGAGAVFVFLIINSVESGQVESHFSNIEDRVREFQFAYAWNSFSTHVLFGVGYGERISGLYIHNFLLASAYMSGFFAFAIALSILIYAATMMFGTSPYRSAMVVFFANSLLSPSVEGIFSLEAWIAMAIVIVTSRTNLRSPPGLIGGLENRSINTVDNESNRPPA